MCCTLAVHTKGVGCSLRRAMYSVIAVMSGSMLVTASRRMRRLVSSLTKRSTKLSHDADVGVK